MPLDMRASPGRAVSVPHYILCCAGGVCPTAAFVAPRCVCLPTVHLDCVVYKSLCCTCVFTVCLQELCAAPRQFWVYVEPGVVWCTKHCICLFRNRFMFVSVFLTQVLNTETYREIMSWFHETNQKAIETDWDSVLFGFFSSSVEHPIVKD